MCGTITAPLPHPAHFRRHLTVLPSPAPDRCVMVLIRHGATEANIQHPPILQGRGINLGLAAIGRRQAELTAEFLADYQIDRLFVSPLIRAQETAAAIAAAQRGSQLIPETVPELTEVDAGNWEGRTWNEIRVTEPEAYRLFHEDASRWGYAGGENMTDVQVRVRPIFERLLADNLGKRIAVVAHNIVNRAYLAALLNVPLIGYRAILQDNCGLNVIERHGDTITLRTLNLVPHLGKSEA